VCNVTRRLGDAQRVILRQSVRGSVRTARAVRNTQVFQTEIMVVADAIHNCGICWLFRQKREPYAPSPILNMSVNGASAIFVLHHW